MNAMQLSKGRKQSMRHPVGQDGLRLFHADTRKLLEYHQITTVDVDAFTRMRRVINWLY